jgi:predicted  nucleic acid-binding Zn-ribbon protein
VQIEDLKAKSKFWATQTRISSETEVKILLTKVDAAYNQIAQLEKGLGEAHKHIEGLNSRKRDLLSRMGLMVPVSELNAAKAESGKLREMIEELKQALRETQGQVEDLNSKIQVARSVQSPARGND